MVQPLLTAMLAGYRKAVTQAFTFAEVKGHMGSREESHDGG